MSVAQRPSTMALFMLDIEMLFGGIELAVIGDSDHFETWAADNSRSYYQLGRSVAGPTDPPGRRSLDLICK